MSEKVSEEELKSYDKEADEMLQIITGQGRALRGWVFIKQATEEIRRLQSENARLKKEVEEYQILVNMKTAFIKKSIDETDRLDRLKEQNRVMREALEDSLNNIGCVQDYSSTQRWKNKVEKALAEVAKMEGK